MPLSPKTVKFLKNMGIEEELLKGAIVIIEDKEIRIRELPIGEK